MSAEESAQVILERARDELDDGLAGRALETLASLPADCASRHLIEGEARLQLGDLPAARAALETAEGTAIGQEVSLAHLRAELLLAEWRIPEAARAFERLAADRPDAATYERLSLCQDLQGDFRAADTALASAARLDHRRPAQPIRLDEGAWEELLSEAIADLPPRYRTALGRACLVTEDLPFAELVLTGQEAETPADTLGLFVGPSLDELAERLPDELPPTIYLFQRNLERTALSDAQLREELRITLYHELGHLLGLDEDEVDELGLA